MGPLWEILCAQMAFPARKSAVYVTVVLFISLYSYYIHIFLLKSYLTNTHLFLITPDQNPKLSLISFWLVHTIIYLSINSAIGSGLHYFSQLPTFIYWDYANYYGWSGSRSTGEWKLDSKDLCSHHYCDGSKNVFPFLKKRSLFAIKPALVIFNSGCVLG